MTKAATRTSTATLAAVMLALVAAGCTIDNATPKGGGPPPPHEMVLASFDDVTSPEVNHFAERVEALSDGALTIAVRSGWAGGTLSSEAQTVRDVANGAADLGWAGTRVFDLLGVDTLRPLHLPFLVDSYPTQAEVVGEGADRLLAGVPDAGVVPLALLAGELRFPAAAAATRPIQDAEDWTGRLVSTWPSDQQAQGLRALGAMPVLKEDDRQTQVAMGTIDIVETSWSPYAHQQLSVATPYVTANAVMWPRTSVLFANPDSHQALTAEQRDWLAAAAADTHDWSIEHAGSTDAEQLTEQCRQGARIALASARQLHAMQSAAQPPYEQLRAQEGQAAVLAWIEEVRQSNPPHTVPPVPAECRYGPSTSSRPPADPIHLPGPGPTGDLPLGTYRIRVTPTAVADLEAELGMPVWSASPDEQDAVVTWILGDGTWDYRVAYSNGRIDPYRCQGYFAVTGNVAWFTTTVDESPGQCAPPSWTALWTSSSDAPNWTNVTPEDFGLIFDVLAWQATS